MAGFTTATSRSISRGPLKACCARRCPTTRSSPRSGLRTGSAIALVRAEPGPPLALEPDPVCHCCLPRWCARLRALAVGIARERSRTDASAGAPFAASNRPAAASARWFARGPAGLPRSPGLSRRGPGAQPPPLAMPRLSHERHPDASRRLVSRSRAAPLEAPGSGRYRPAQRPRRERGRSRTTQRISSPPSAAELAIRRGPVMRQLKLAFLTMLLTAGAGTVDQPRGQGQADHPRSSWLVVEGLLPHRTLRRTAIGLAAAEHRPDHSGQLVGNAPWPTSDRRRAGCGAGCRRDRHRSRAGYDRGRRR